jgi:leucyl-tRNA synthetase
MTAQLRRAGWGYDWAREVATSHLEYYRWNQWFFLQFYKRGLAVKKTAPVNWCDSCQTVLATEQVREGVCERCGSPVAQKDMSQWFFTMSQYAERLLAGHKQLRGKWPDAVLAMQEEWIGRSEGAKVFFKIAETGDPVPVFTTRPDTLFGVTFMSIAPEHPLLKKLLAGTPQEKSVRAAAAEMRKSGTSVKELADKEKVGIATGFHVVNPVNGDVIPLWVANFALMTYGTGAVMSVPAHDDRDFEFARKYGLPIKAVIQPTDGTVLDPATMTAAYTEPGKLSNCGEFTGQLNTQAMSAIIKWLGARGYGEGTINYRLRDWLISRQRYWGTPIPIIYCDKCGTVPVPEKDLPVQLPTDAQFRGDGNPLATSPSFVNCKCPKCGGDARRETDTMDTFVDSSWYFLRYCDTKNRGVDSAAAFDPAEVKHWAPVDQYVGGIEHATMHLIYARFFTLALHDLGLIDFTEPFTRLFCQGMACKTAYRCEKDKWLKIGDVEFADAAAKDKTSGVVGKCKKCGGDANAEMTKISKTKLNIVDPDELFDRVGADTVRLYMLSDTPPDRMQIWNEAGLNGAWRTINRLRLTVEEFLSPRPSPLSPNSAEGTDAELFRKTHQCIFAVTEAIEDNFHFNTAIARCNELLNQFRQAKNVGADAARFVIETVLRIMAPMVPHFAEEMWESLGHHETIFRAGWPVADPKLAAETTVEIPVQINGKLKARINVSPAAAKDELEKIALADAAVQAALADKTVAKVIAVPGRMVNVVAK